MQNIKFFFLPVLLFFVSACVSSKESYQGIKHPQTNSLNVSFQEQTISDTCSVFAHLLTQSKGASTGQDIATAMRTEAMSKGANLLLVGMAREVTGEELENNVFDYYGPEYSYSFNKTWLGWKFGFSAWNKGDRLIGLGTDTWGNNEIIFQNSLLIQAVLLRCEEQ